jgi:glycosyltransferase involved in cell wall biosynthesis
VRVDCKDFSQPFVSICLLTYNRCEKLRPTLESLLIQSHTNFELIINDDNSPDDTEILCREYERRDNRISYFKNVKNLRYAGNQNAALARANSDLVAIVHDGDIYRPDLIAKWAGALTKYGSAALVFNSLDEMDLNGKVINTYSHCYPPLVNGRSLLLEMIQVPFSPIYGIVMVRKSCISQVGEFDVALPTLCDVDMWMRLLERFDAAYISEPLIKISAREIGHYNHIGNWQVKIEYERIYRNGVNRSFSLSVQRNVPIRRKVWRMLWCERIRWLGILSKRIQIHNFIKGLLFCFRFPLLKL